jgi:hypothetical protein
VTPIHDQILHVSGGETRGRSLARLVPCDRDN